VSSPLLIAVDVDEVCADLISHWVRLYNLQWNDDLKVEDIHGWNIDSYVKPECGKAIYHLLSRPGMYDGVSPVPGAREAVEELRKLGRVVFLSSCARGTMDAKFSWLQRHGFLPNTGPAIADFIVAKDKWLVGADILFDDGVHNVDAFKGIAYLVSAHHNLTTPCTRRRISSLAEAPAKVRLMFRDRL